MAKKNIATFLGAGKGLVTIGDHAYAYSGVVTFDDTETDALSFTTGNRYISAQALISTLDYNGDDAGIKIKLNDIIIIQQRFSTLGVIYLQALPAWDIIIPPLTQVTMTLTNLADNTPHTANLVVTGRVYDA